LNPILSLSLANTIFSFVGVPPLIGFFAKQAVLSAGLENQSHFLVLIAILTSVIGGVYYLMIIKTVFYDKPHKKNPLSPHTPYGFFSERKEVGLEGEVSLSSPGAGEGGTTILSQTINLIIKNRLSLSSLMSIPISILSLISSLFI
jgi:NADH:ubiquinone oxidoreductase subunit 5 (subunit L)/multisubunit Na+/H+ antiporter MnhA subunit